MHGNGILATIFTSRVQARFQQLRLLLLQQLPNNQSVEILRVLL